MDGTVRSADGVTVRYEVHGDGTPALVFVHGWSCDRTYWRGQLDHFAKRYRVVAVDLAGHGGSGQDRQAWTMGGFGDDVAAVVAHLDLTDTVLIGHSMGGDVVVEAALRLPGRVSGLVWVDVYGSLGEAPLDKAGVDRFLEPFEADFAAATRDFVQRLFLPDSPADVVARVAADMSSAPPRVALDAMRYAISNERAAAAGLRELALPAAAINPEDGHTDAESLARYGVLAVLVPGVGHFPMLEKPAAFNRVLDDVVSVRLR
jgi:pimeloyl-ACP methyl ester carboxylesterase